MRYRAILKISKQFLRFHKFRTVAGFIFSTEFYARANTVETRECKTISVFTVVKRFTYITLSSFHVGSLSRTYSVRYFCLPMPKTTEALHTPKSQTLRLTTKSVETLAYPNKTQSLIFKLDFYSPSPFFDCKFRAA